MQVSKSDAVALLVALGVESAARWDAARIAERLMSPGGVGRYLATGAEPPSDHVALFHQLMTAYHEGAAIHVVDAPQSAPAPETFRLPGADEPDDNPVPFAKPEEATVPTSTKPAAVKSVAKAAKSAAVKSVAKATKPAPAAAAKPAGKGKGKSPAKPAGKPAAGKGKEKPAATGNRGGRKPAELPPGIERGSYAAWKYSWQKRYGETGYAPITKRAVVAQAIVDELRATGKRKDPGVTKEFIVEVITTKFPERKPEQVRSYVNNMVPSRLRDEYGYHCHKSKTDTGETVYWLPGDGRTPQKEGA